MSQFKCHFCNFCNGKGCIGELPGMGGIENSCNFISNCAAWENLRNSDPELKEYVKTSTLTAKLGVAPMTGAVQNMGFDTEGPYYKKMMEMCLAKNIELTIGDGEPDEKLLFGINAVKELNASCYVFIKPYPNYRILERMDWAKDVAKGLGIDIDSYNIITMRKSCSLEKKNFETLNELKKKAGSLGVPFIVKGVFTEENLEIMKELKPDGIYISNHGGRVLTQKGNTASFLKKHSAELKKYCNTLWVDGGLRTNEDFLTAQYYGADFVLMGRPFITELCRSLTPALS